MELPNLFIDEDGDACFLPSGADCNLVALPARDERGELLNPEIWHGMIEAWNRRADLATPLGAVAMREASDEGPQELPKRYTCDGCKHLVTREWEEEADNDGTDSGTDARCTKADRPISAYWFRTDKPPEWCPAPAPTPDHAALLAAALKLPEVARVVTAYKMTVDIQRRWESRTHADPLGNNGAVNLSIQFEKADDELRIALAALEGKP